jgi:hypothetical protein
MKKVSLLLIVLLLSFQVHSMAIEFNYFSITDIDGESVSDSYRLGKITDNLWVIRIDDLSGVLNFEFNEYNPQDNSSRFIVINNFIYIELGTDNLYLNYPNGSVLKMPLVVNYTTYYNNTYLDIPLEFITNLLGYSAGINEVEKTLSFKTTLPPGSNTLNKIISEDITLTKDKSPYYLTQNTLLDTGTTMTIEKGVEIISVGNYYFQIRGNINAIGTNEEKIYFKSYSNRSWYGLQIGKNSTIKAGSIYFDNCVFSGARTALNCYSDTTLTNCTFENNIEAVSANSIVEYDLVGGSYMSCQDLNAVCDVNLTNCDIKNNETAIIVFTNSTFNIENCKIIDNWYGISFYSDGLLNIKNSDIVNNEIGIRASGDPTINISKCNIKNSYYNFQCYSENGKITATNNYWGTTDQLELSARIFDFYDNFNLAKVIFKPYLDETMQEQPIPFINPYQIKNIYVTDMQGNLISSIVNLSKITVNLDYIKKEVYQQNVNIMIGLYEKNTNKFIGITNIISNDVIGINNKIIVTVDLPNISKEYYIKGFIWDLSNSKPLAYNIMK